MVLEGRLYTNWPKWPVWFKMLLHYQFQNFSIILISRSQWKLDNVMSELESEFPEVHFFFFSQLLIVFILRWNCYRLWFCSIDKWWIPTTLRWTLFVWGEIKFIHHYFETLFHLDWYSCQQCGTVNGVSWCSFEYFTLSDINGQPAFH